MCGRARAVLTSPTVVKSPGLKLSTSKLKLRKKPSCFTKENVRTKVAANPEQESLLVKRLHQTEYNPPVEKLQDIQNTINSTSKSLPQWIRPAKRKAEEPSLGMNQSDRASLGLNHLNGTSFRMNQAEKAASALNQSDKAASGLNQSEKSSVGLNKTNAQEVNQKKPLRLNGHDVGKERSVVRRLKDAGLDFESEDSEIEEKLEVKSWKRIEPPRGSVSILVKNKRVIYEDIDGDEEPTWSLFPTMAESDAGDMDVDGGKENDLVYAKDVEDKKVDVVEKVNGSIDDPKCRMNLRWSIASDDGGDSNGDHERDALQGSQITTVEVDNGALNRTSMEDDDVQIVQNSEFCEVVVPSNSVQMNSRVEEVVEIVNMEKPSRMHGKWSCALCRIENDSNITICVGCREMKVSTLSRDVHVEKEIELNSLSDTWLCEICCYTNRKSTNVCSACGTTIPATEQCTVKDVVESVATFPKENYSSYFSQFNEYEGQYNDQLQQYDTSSSIQAPQYDTPIDPPLQHFDQQVPIPLDELCEEIYSPPRQKPVGHSPEMEIIDVTNSPPPQAIFNIDQDSDSDISDVRTTCVIKVNSA